MEKLEIPNKLYGREQDILKLLELFEHISSGYGEVLLVPGSSGVGKTALVQELQIPVRERNGFFIRGKFDQYQQNIPYSAFRQALAQLCMELQSDDELQRLRFKSDILLAIGDLGKLLIDMVPEFESFLGVQPDLADISPQEARHRFADLFRNFLKVICCPDHPLVLFIDDWQWADSASCELLKQIQVGVSVRYLLVIVSYRENEVGPGHSLMSAINDMQNHSVSVGVLPVKNITANDVKELVIDTFKPAIINIEGLVTIIHGKTQGNPFFVRSFLSFLFEFKLIQFGKVRNCWRWSIGIAGGAELPNNVIELFVLKFRRLNADSRNLFSLAACLGNRFDIETLSIISDKDPEECLKLLFPDKTYDILLPLVSDRGPIHAEYFSTPKVCAFLHDRVQQAAFMTIEPSELPNILLKIGRLLLNTLHSEQIAESLFEIVNDLNAGYDLILDNAEKVKVVDLNIIAGRKAYAATAYSSALQFYLSAVRFMENGEFAGHLWSNFHDLTMSLFKELAVCEFLEGNKDDSEKYIQISVAHCITPLEKADALNILISQFTLQAKYPEAISAGRQALAILGIVLSEENFEEARDQEIAQVRKKLKNHPVSSLTELPVMSNPEMLMASKILITMGPPCYRSHQRLWSVIVPKVVNLTLSFGNIPQVGYSHTAFGGLLGWVDDDYATAKEFGELATRLMTDTFQSATDQSVFYLMIGSSIRHWFKHLKYGTQDYTDAYEIGLRSGNLQYAAYAFGHNMYCRFYQSAPLAGLIPDSQHSLEFSRTHLNEWAIDLLEGGLNIFGILNDNHSELYENKDWSEEEYLRRVEDHHNIQVACIFKILKTFSLLLYEDNENALLLSDETEPLIYTVGTQGLLPWPEHVFARLLILTSLYSQAEEKQQIKWRTELNQTIKRLRIWADNCPENFEHKFLLASAELAKIDGKTVEAMQFYDSAITAAQAGNFLQWEGIANERAYHFWMEYGNEHLAFTYWQQAYVCYNRWGAFGKVYTMESNYRAHLAKILPLIEGCDKQDKMQKLNITNVLVERKINQLRNYELQMQQTTLRIEAATQAEELSNAMKRLRVEIAERKHKEDEVKLKNEELQLLNSEKDKFFSIIAHDIRSPFSSFLGLTQIMAEELPSLTMAEIQQISVNMNNSATNLFRLLENLLEWARVKQGLITFSPSVVCLLTVINESMTIVKEVANNKGIEIDYDIPGNLMVFADSNMLQTIIRNLASNALKFTSKGGKMNLSAKITGENRAEISVKDSGIGMSSAMVNNLFRLDGNANRPGTEGEPSTGLGLLLCKEFVDKHGGKIWVESEEGKGSTFFFTLLISSNK